MGLELVGSDLGLGRRASWAVHGIGAWVVHVWCMGGAWRGVVIINCCVLINDAG